MRILLITDLYPLFDDWTIPTVIEDFSIALKGFCEIEVIRPNFLLNLLIRKRKFVKTGLYEKNGIMVYNRNFFLPFLREDLSFLKNKKYDLIISHMPCGHIYADLINKQLKLKRISIVHQSDYRVLSDKKYSFYFKNRLQKALNNSNKIGARNSFLAQKLNADFILPSFIEKEKIVKNKELISNKKLKIITLAKLIKRKNIDKIILALKNLNYPFEFEICGIGKEEKRLKKLVKKYKLEEKIKFLGQIDHDLVFDKLDENDIFVLPSINETFGLSYLEAMARGLIVIGSKNTGIDGIIRNGENGFLINPTENEILNVLNNIAIMSQEDKYEIIINSLKTIKEFEKEKIITKYVTEIKKNL